MGGTRRARTAARRVVIAGLAAFLSLAVIAAPGVAAAPLSIRVEGNHFVNGEGQALRLLGVDRTSSEYACAEDYAYDDGHFDDADAAAIASWNANAVRVPLNEDCWLGINLPAGDPYGGAGYRQEIEQYVAALNAHGIYAILDLHWTAPEAQLALEQQPMPDAHSIPFWESVAATFKSDPAVVFDLFNEPFSPTDPRSGEDPDPLHAVTWDCWRDGGCATDSFGPNGEELGLYIVVGMQKLVDAIRSTGATQPVMAGGLNFANDISEWVDHAPADPLNQVAASFHNYQGFEKCDNVGCWNSEIAPVANVVPVVTGEFAEDVCTPSNFDNEYMDWADAHGVSYLGWAWIVLSQEDKEAEGCEAFTMISDYGGTPAAPNGTSLHDHLLALRAGTPAPAPGGGSGGANPAPAPTKFRLIKFRSTVVSGGAKVRFQIEAAETCKATIVGQTAKSFKLGGGKPRKVGLGTAHANLTAGKTTTVTLALPAKARSLLKSKGSLLARYTVTLSGGGANTIATPTATLKEPKPKKH